MKKISKIKKTGRRMDNLDFNQLDEKGIELPLEERVGRHRGFPKSKPQAAPRLPLQPASDHFTGLDSEQI